MIVETDEEFIEGLEHLRFMGSFFWERWYINHVRRKEGKEPFRDDIHWRPSRATGEPAQPRTKK